MNQISRAAEAQSHSQAGEQSCRHEVLCEALHEALSEARCGALRDANCRMQSFEMMPKVRGQRVDAGCG